MECGKIKKAMKDRFYSEVIFINKFEDVGKSFKLISARLRKNNKENHNNKELKHICTNCKYRNMHEGYDQQWEISLL